MKKLLAALLTLCMLFTLAACGGGGSGKDDPAQGVTITNSLGWTLDEIYIVATGAKDWGKPIIKQLSHGADGSILLEQRFGRREVTVDIRAIDSDGDIYEVYDVILKDGDACMMKLDDELGFVVTIGDASFIGNWRAAQVQEEIDVSGVWEYEAYELYLLFDPDGSYAFITKQSPEIANEGTYTIEEDIITLHSDDGSNDTLQMNDSRLYDSDNDSLRYLDTLESDLYYSILDSLAEEPAYFEQMGYEVNYAFGDGNVTLSDGAKIYITDGSKYATFPLTISIVRDSYNDTQDGYVEIEFTRVAYLDAEDYPDFYFNSRTTASTTQWFWDYYTGAQLLEGDGAVDGNTERGDNYHFFEYESQGKTITIEMNFSTEWYQKDDLSYVLSMQYFVRMPADYDGLLYAVMPQHPDYATYIANQSDPGGVDRVEVRDDPLLQNAVICRVNTAD